MRQTMFIVALAILVIGCSDATMGKLTSTLTGKGADIKCYSGDKLIYEGRSTGKVSSEAQSDGYFFRDAKDNQLKEVSGNCIISYD